MICIDGKPPQRSWRDHVSDSIPGERRLNTREIFFCAYSPDKSRAPTMLLPLRHNRNCERWTSL
jgi:hypothetical protein